MARIFISYATPDRMIADEVAGWLRVAGHAPFLTHGLRDGVSAGGVVFSPDGRTLASAGDDKTIILRGLPSCWRSARQGGVGASTPPA